MASLFSIINVNINNIDIKYENLTSISRTNLHDSRASSPIAYSQLIAAALFAAEHLRPDRTHP